MKRRVIRLVAVAVFLLPLFASEQEDLQVLLGADKLANGAFEEARKIYQKLYEESKKSIYAKQIAIACAAGGDLSTAFQYALLYQNTSKDTKDLPTSKIIADNYIKSGEIKKAIALLESIKQQEESPLIDNILGTLYLNQKQFDKALGLLSQYYEFSKDEEALKKILAIYLSRNENQKVLDTLSSALRDSDCSEDLCSKAIEIFNQFGANKQADEIFKNQYQTKPTMQNAKYYLQVLINQKKFQEAEDIAKNFPFDRALLLDLFIAQNKFSDAAIQAKRIYEEKKDIRFLAWSAVYRYQTTKGLTLEELKSIINDLSGAIVQIRKQRQDNKENPNNEDAFFYNFLGYMLIEHDFDIKQGIALIKDALAIAPNSIAYVDSLAWGYFKLGDCTQAQNIFSTIPREMVKQDEELKKHFDLIKKCQ